MRSDERKLRLNRPRLFLLLLMTTIAGAAPAGGSDTACIGETPIALPGLGASPAAGAVCSPDPWSSPEHWRTLFCRDPEEFCEQLDQHPLPLRACTKSTEQVISSFQKQSELEPNDMAGLFPKSAMDRVRSFIEGSKAGLIETLQSPKWQTPDVITSLVRSAVLVDPNDPNTPAEKIETLNGMCNTEIDSSGYPGGGPAEGEDEKTYKARIRVLREQISAASESAEMDKLPDHLALGLQAAASDDGSIYVCPATLKLATEASPEAFLTILLHELGHLAGSCNVGMALIKEAKPDPAAGCAMAPASIDALPSGRERLDYLTRLHGRMHCMEEAGISNPGNSAKKGGKMMTGVIRRNPDLGKALECLFTEEQLRAFPGKAGVTGLLQTCQMTNARLLLYMQNLMAKDEDDSLAEKLSITVRSLRIAKQMKFPNENQFMEAHADALSAESLPRTLELLRTSGVLPATDSADRLIGLLQAPATACSLKTRGWSRKRLDHGPEEYRVRTLQLTPSLRAAMGCSPAARGTADVRKLEACLMRDPLKPGGTSAGD